jgi:hypothetical protein
MLHALARSLRPLSFVAALAAVACTDDVHVDDDAPPTSVVDGGAHDVVADGGGAPASDAGTIAGDGGVVAVDGGAVFVDAGALVYDECVADDAWCPAWNARRACVATPAGRRVVDETCGGGCRAGACVADRCSDECALGAVDDAKTCTLYDVAAAGWVDADATSSMHDRARAYDALLWRDAFRYTGMGGARYADPGAWTQVIGWNGLGDSALHFGEAMAGEALRAIETGGADARARVRRGVEALHVLWNVTGHRGVLARHAVPEDAPDWDLFGLDCAHQSHHCGVPYDGKTWGIRGHISRDMYQGVMLAYGLAYDAVPEEDVRATIREDVVSFVEELMVEKTVTIQLVYDGTELPRMEVDMPFSVVIPEELIDGAIYLSYGGDEGAWRGFQEFMPNLSDVLKQVLGPFAPPTIPRPGSALMLTSYFTLALHVTDGVPAYAARRAAIEDFFLHHDGLGGNVNDWLDVAALWQPGGDGDDGCGRRYYANNLSMQPLYNWARIEQDPARLDFALGLLEGRAWEAFAAQKNPFFSFLIQGLARDVDEAGAAEAAAQLSGFGPPPRVRVAIDVREDPRYQAREPDCGEQLAHDQAVDVADRGVDDFIWQGHAWALTADADPSLTAAGGDYLVAYWLGREHGFIADDRPTTCTRWR